MVRTRRHGAPPPELVRRRAQWTSRWRQICTERTPTDWATRAAKRILRPELRRLAHGKCVYCECRLERDTHIEIEHHTAKTVSPELAFEWSNLFPACRWCNEKKGEVDHGGLLLKADAEDPEPYFWVDPEGRLQPHPSLDLDEGRKRRAETTLRICDLQRGALCESRVLMMKMVRFLLDDPDADSLVERLDLLLAPQREHKLVIRRTLEALGYPQLADEDRRRFEAPPAR